MMRSLSVVVALRWSRQNNDAIVKRRRHGVVGPTEAACSERRQWGQRARCRRQVIDGVAAINGVAAMGPSIVIEGHGVAATIAAMG